MTERIDCVVIGAGVVGLAIARELALSGVETLILEKAGAIGTEASSRNSEVIHAGLYYPAGSLKARLCVAGRALIYRYCEERGIGYRRCGKLIVATNRAQVPQLNDIVETGRANGVDDLERLTREEAQSLEGAALQCEAAILSPSTGIFDSHALMVSLHGEFEAAGGLIALRTPVLGGALDAHGVILTAGGSESMALHAGLVINCAGLDAPSVARSLGVDPVPQSYWAKGSYFSLAGRSPFSRLIYPVPDGGGLGIHLTLDLQGRARFGPDVQWVDEVDYRVEADRADAFEAAIRRYWPDLPANALQPDYAGVRAKLSGPGEAPADFMIDTAHIASGLINLYGIDSPGLTAALAIGQHVAALYRGEAGVH